MSTVFAHRLLHRFGPLLPGSFPSPFLAYFAPKGTKTLPA